MAVNVSKVNVRRGHSQRVDRKDAQEREFDWQDLVGSSYLDWNSHRELFVRISCRLFIFLGEVPPAGGQDGPVRLELGPDLKLAIALDVAKSWIELKVLSEVFREGKLDLHAVGRPVEEDDLLAVLLFVDQNVKVVLLLLDVNRHIDARAFDADWDWCCVVLVFKEEGESLVD